MADEESNVAVNLVANGARWKRVKAPRVWRPADGEILIGVYRGRRPKSGSHGPYEVALIETTELGSFTVSGSVVMSLLESVPEGETVRIEFLGYRSCANNAEHTYKAFEVFQLDGAR